MSINTEYQKHLDDGGTLTLTEYADHLNHLKTTMGNLINFDPRNHASDIGNRIFKNLDLQNRIAFSQISKGLNARSKTKWFEANSKEIVLKYVKQKTSFKAFLKDGGWKDFVVLSFNAAGAALTITAGVRASVHKSRIPPDAPKKTVTVTDSEGDDYEVTVIDHPEYKNYQMWTTIAATAGTITMLGTIGHGLYSFLKNVDLDVFFSVSEREITGSAKTNIGLKVVAPSFHEWKVNRIRKNFLSNPSNWENNDRLNRMVCPLSGDFILFPVKDRCGHYFDYRSLRAYQLLPGTQNPLECPVSRIKPNRGLASIKFDKARFDYVQRIIRA